MSARQPPLRLLLLLAVLALAPAPAALGAEPPSDWEFEMVPYLWLPTLTGSASVRGVQASVDTSFWKLLGQGDLAIGLMAQLEARWRNRWGALVDGTWMYVRQDDNLENTFLHFDATSNLGLVEGYGFYRITDRELTQGLRGTLDALAGFRVTILNANLDFLANTILTPNDISDTEVWADPLIGARGALRFGPDQRWSFRVRGDLGGFGAGSEFTWQALGGIGYSFRLCSVPAEIWLGGRALYQNYRAHGGDFRWRVTQYGPVLALGLSF